MKDRIDADRGFLEQVEELAMIDDDAMKWLIEEVYEKSQRLELFSAPLSPNLGKIIKTIHFWDPIKEVARNVNH